MLRETLFKGYIGGISLRDVTWVEGPIRLNSSIYLWWEFNVRQTRFNMLVIIKYDALNSYHKIYVM